MVAFILSPSFVIYSIFILMTFTPKIFIRRYLPEDIYPFSPLCYNANVPENKKYKNKPNLIQIDYWLNKANNV